MVQNHDTLNLNICCILPYVSNLFLFCGLPNCQYYISLSLLSNVGGSRDQTTLHHSHPHDHHRPTHLRKIRNIDAFHGSPRERGLSRRVSISWHCKHHRLLHHLGPRHGNGSHLFSSLRSQATGHHGTNPPPNHRDATSRFHTNFSPLAKHQPNPPPLRPRPNHFLHRLHLPRFLDPRPFLPILHQPSQNLLAYPKHNSSVNAQCSFFALHSRPHQLLSSALSPPWD